MIKMKIVSFPFQSYQLLHLIILSVILDWRKRQRTQPRVLQNSKQDADKLFQISKYAAPLHAPTVIKKRGGENFERPCNLLNEHGAKMTSQKYNCHYLWVVPSYICI